jgi:hypothetical protein
MLQHGVYSDAWLSQLQSCYSAGIAISVTVLVLKDLQ